VLIVDAKPFPHIKEHFWAIVNKCLTYLLSRLVVPLINELVNVFACKVLLCELKLFWRVNKIMLLETFTYPQHYIQHKIPWWVAKINNVLSLSTCGLGLIYLGLFVFLWVHITVSIFWQSFHLMEFIWPRMISCMHVRLASRMTKRKCENLWRHLR